MHILIKYASRSRPEKFFEGLHNIIDMAADKVNYTVLCCLDKDDMSWNGVFANQYLNNADKFSRVVFNMGYSKSKIDAINRPIPDGLNWDILVNFSDDMRFTVFGYDQLIREGFRCTGPDKFLHYPDSTAQNMLATMSIIDKTYYDRDSYVYHPSYQSLFCDNEAQEVAKIRGCYQFMGTQIFEHYHPAYGMAQWDEQYHRQQALWNEDELNYYHRKSHNFYLDEVIHTNSNS